MTATDEAPAETTPPRGAGTSSAYADLTDRELLERIAASLEGLVGQVDYIATGTHALQLGTAEVFEAASQIGGAVRSGGLPAILGSLGGLSGMMGSAPVIAGETVDDQPEEPDNGES